MIIYFLFYFIFNFMYFKKGFFYMKLYVAKIVFNYNIIYNLNNNNRKKVNFNKSSSLKKRKKKKEEYYNFRHATKEKKYN